MSTITVTVSPPDAGHTSLVVYGQLYSCAYGSTISVPANQATLLGTIWTDPTTAGQVDVVFGSLSGTTAKNSRMYSASSSRHTARHSPTTAII